MFQLVVAVISIALIAFLALTSLYYGGDAFSASSLRAGVTTLVNGGTQIAGAATIYKTDMGGVEAATLAELTSPASGISYLSQVPGGSAITTGAWSISADGEKAVISFNAKADKDDVCTEVARQAGNSGQFTCNADKTAFEYKL